MQAIKTSFCDALASKASFTRRLQYFIALGLTVVVCMNTIPMGAGRQSRLLLSLTEKQVSKDIRDQLQKLKKTCRDAKDKLEDAGFEPFLSTYFDGHGSPKTELLRLQTEINKAVERIEKETENEVKTALALAVVDLILPIVTFGAYTYAEIIGDLWDIFGEAKTWNAIYQQMEEAASRMNGEIERIAKKKKEEIKIQKDREDGIKRTLQGANYLMDDKEKVMDCFKRKVVELMIKNMDFVVKLYGINGEIKMYDYIWNLFVRFKLLNGFTKKKVKKDVLNFLNNPHSVGKSGESRWTNLFEKKNSGDNTSLRALLVNSIHRQPQVGKDSCERWTGSLANILTNFLMSLDKKKHSKIRDLVLRYKQMEDKNRLSKEYKKLGEFYKDAKSNHEKDLLSKGLKKTEKSLAKNKSMFTDPTQWETLEIKAMHEDKDYFDGMNLGNIIDGDLRNLIEYGTQKKTLKTLTKDNLHKVSMIRRMYAIWKIDDENRTSSKESDC